MSDYLQILRQQLPFDEGYKRKPYTDTMGKLTIGVGRNLDDVGVHDDEIALMLENDLAAAEKTARALVLNFDQLTDARKAVVMNMALNLGLPKLAQFVNTLRAIKEGRWDDAAHEMMNSKWARDVGERAKRLAAEMRVG